MAREFSDGARQKWTSPIRLYLATSLLLFGYIALSGTQLVAFGAKLNPDGVVKANIGDKNIAPQIFFLERRSKIKETVTDDAITALETNIANMMKDDENKSKEELEAELKRLKESLAKLDSQIDNAANEFAKTGINQGRKPMLDRIQALEERIENFNSSPNDNQGTSSPTTETSPEDSGGNIDIVDATGNKMTLNSEGIQQAMSIALRQPERINAPISKYLPRIMFVMMPFSMLLGAIFIRGREKAMLYDHLVHAAYIHAFSFLLLFVFILLVQFTPIPGLLAVYTLILLIYLPISAKRMFGRGWFKSFLTSYGVGAFYTFIMMLILSFLVGIGVSDILKDVAIKA